MSPERRSPNDPQEWLSRARSNLVQARGLQPGVYLEDLCFQAQQAAEKAPKALLLRSGISFPYVHDLGQLLSLLEQSEEDVPRRIREAARLNVYAVEARYPGLSEPVNSGEYQEALALAENVVRWAEGRMEGESAPL